MPPPTSGLKNNPRMKPARSWPETKNDCTGEGQQQITSLLSSLYTVNVALKLKSCMLRTKLEALIHRDAMLETDMQTFQTLHKTAVTTT
jgi:hypothetical protein